MGFTLILLSWLTTFSQRRFLFVRVGHDHLPVAGFWSCRISAASHPSGSEAGATAEKYGSMMIDVTGGG
jgi:hypothetical protein